MKININRINIDGQEVTLTDNETKIIYTADFRNGNDNFVLSNVRPHLVDTEGKIVAPCPKKLNQLQLEDIIKKLSSRQKEVLESLLPEIQN